MASHAGLLSTWPWECLRGAKYLLLLPFVAEVVRSTCLGAHETDNWSLHMLLLCVLRRGQGQLWMSLSRWCGLFGKREIQRQGTSFEQVDREQNWDNFMFLQVLLATAFHQWLPGFSGMPLVNWPGLGLLLLLHVGPTECLYYWAHRLLLHHPCLFPRYHSHHHLSVVTEPVSGCVHTFAEAILLSLIFSVPVLGTWAVGGASIAMLYVYWLGLDLFTFLAHCNYELLPPWLYYGVPGLKYLIAAPSYHSLHHSHLDTNFCLFMPLYDYIGGTVDPASSKLHNEIWNGRNDCPSFVFLAHGTTLLSVLQLPFSLPFFDSRPLLPDSSPASWLQFLLLWPVALPILLFCWVTMPAFSMDKWQLREWRLRRWIMPRLGINYFLPWEKDSINALIERAILDADKGGVKVFALGGLNKNEALNAGGTVFVEKHPGLGVRVVHGNTLTAGVVLHCVPPGTREVFLTGSTSKLGRAISLYLCRKGVRVLMLTTSLERFEAIRAEAEEEHRELLVQCQEYQEGSHCKVWIVGKWMTRRDQRHAPPGSLFLQFALPPVEEVRSDCTYSPLAGMRIPPDSEGVRSCEVTMPRNCIHACHAGGLVHLLEGWEHHEVGAVDPSKIDMTWEAAMRHGFRPMWLPDSLPNNMAASECFGSCGPFPGGVGAP